MINSAEVDVLQGTGIRPNKPLYTQAVAPGGDVYAESSDGFFAPVIASCEVKVSGVGQL